jgi:hypothetical protein
MKMKIMFLVLLVSIPLALCFVPGVGLGTDVAIDFTNDLRNLPNFDGSGRLTAGSDRALMGKVARRIASSSGKQVIHPEAKPWGVFISNKSAKIRM